MDTSRFRTWAEIDTDALLYNFATIQNLLPKDTKIAAVIKANAYGHGAITVAKALEGKADFFAVAMAEEGYELRNAGIRLPILVLGHSPEGQFASMIRRNIAATVCDLDEAKKLSEVALSLGTKAKVHLAIDTGMSRIGFLPSEASLAEIKAIAALEGLMLEGAFSHFAMSDTPDNLGYANTQWQRFISFIDRIKTEGISLPICHISNSAAVFTLPASLDMVRLGIALYGLCPSGQLPLPQSHRLRPVMHLRSRITQIQTLPAGTPVSYSCTFVTEKETRVATICIGYADGIPRLLSGKGSLLIKGKKAPILGRVCMDQLMIDVSDIPEAKKGDTVTVFGIDHGVCQSADEIAAICDTIGYEVITGIDRRVPRITVLGDDVVEINSSLPFC